MTSTAPTATGSFAGAGWRELRRRLDRARLRGDLKRHDAARQAARVALGRAAWQQGLDLAPWPDLRERLAAVATEAGAASASSQRLAQEQQALEAERRDAAARFDAERQALDQRRQPVDAAARAARQLRQASEAALARGQAHLAALDAKLGAAAADAPEAAALRAERVRHAEDTERARAALPTQVADDTRLAAEAEAIAGEVAAMETRRRTTLAEFDRRLAELRQAVRGASQQAGALQASQDALLGELGVALQAAAAAGGPPQPALAPAFAALHAAERDRAGTEAAIAASQAETDRLPAGTMPLFWGTLAAIVLLLAAAVWGATWWQRRQALRAEPAVAVATPRPTDATPAPPAPGTCAPQDPPVQGPGVAVFSDCARWEGEFLERRLHGRGVKAWPSGERMEGQFWNGYLDGAGVHVRSDGSRREGTFNSGRLFGPGKLTEPDGTVWDGRFWNNAVVGWAVRRTPDGVVVAGDWREIEGRLMPLGTMLRVTPDGRREKVEAGVLEPRLAAIIARAAAEPAPADPKAY